MISKTCIITVMSVILAGPDVSSQNRNLLHESIGLHIGTFAVPSASSAKEAFSPVKMIGLSFTHRLQSRWSISLSYYRWYNARQLWNFVPAHGNGFAEELPPFSEWKSGLVSNRFNYQFMDASVVCAPVCWGHHKVEIGIGPSFAWGKNMQIVSFLRYPGYPDAIIESEAVAANYWGGLFNLNYSYAFSKHLRAGVYAGLRIYSGLPAQQNYGLSLSYDFALFPNSSHSTTVD